LRRLFVEASRAVNRCLPSQTCFFGSKQELSVPVQKSP
jgi:hypothetical protein